MLSRFFISNRRCMFRTQHFNRIVLHRNFVHGTTLLFISEKKKAIQFNKEIMRLGATGKWKQLLFRFQEEKSKGYVDNVNYATIMVQFGKIVEKDKSKKIEIQDSVELESFLYPLAYNFEVFGVQWMDTRLISNIVHAMAKLELKNNPYAEKIINIISQKDNMDWFLDSSNTQDISNMVWAFATLGNDCHLLFSGVGQRADWLVNNGTTQAISNTVWAFATIGNDSPGLFNTVAKRADWLVENGTTQAVANTAWAFATVGNASPILFSAVAKRADWLVENGTTQNIANIVWAFATVGNDSPELFTSIAKRADWLVENGTTQAVANTAWAFATVGNTSPILFSAVAKQADWWVENGNSQAIANTVWAFATVGNNSPALFMAVAKRADWFVKNGNVQGISNMLWAFATVGDDSPELFTAAAKRADWLVENGNAQDIVNTAWAFATAGHDAPELFTAIAKRADWLVENGNAQIIANTSWAFASVGYYCPELCTAVVKKADWLIQNGTPQNIANTMLALAKLAYDPSSLFTSLAARVDHFISVMNARDGSDILYSLAVSGSLATFKDIFTQIWMRLITLNIGDDNIIRTIAYTQLVACTYGLKLQRPPAVLISRIESLTGAGSVSKFQKDVSVTLDQLGFEHDQEVNPVLQIDLACTERMVAIECDGPRHYIRHLGENPKVAQNDALIENGPTRAKRRLLEKLGWRVINVPYVDYGTLKSRKERNEWMRTKLVDIGITL